ncbi:MAG: hypothetical protein KIY12_08365 [Thermoplasmata archaeon]|uniref:DUF35 domain-containing protein n=1 Tax=Candidatus Sysuiplasma superficiale TaxID=2823368 RepID=A0A8J7YPW5_9ARCH|nr:hypothetical protein [Candidatus Sysuiplasma superficiale]MBX8644718.1 hypothetical protein [Candidatus Sysuiplasma superficiale]MCL5437241.1 hypothetical protein [Candidatus Thermoplasmatota archaeon]
MKIFRCKGCGYCTFERRAVCPLCAGVEFDETESGPLQKVAEATLFVTPSGFGESYSIELLRSGKTLVLRRVETERV